MHRSFQLVKDAETYGLSCTPEGLFLAGAPLLCRTVAGFAPRPSHELGALMKGAYNASLNSADLSAGLNVIAEALNRGDLGRAMVAALHLRLPDLDRVGAAGVALADDFLAKYPGQPRDWHGRFTDGKETPDLSVSGHRQNRFAAYPKPRSVFSSPTFLAARRLALAEEVVGGGPEDPFAYGGVGDRRGETRSS